MLHCTLLFITLQLILLWIKIEKKNTYSANQFRCFVTSKRTWAVNAHSWVPENRNNFTNLYEKKYIENIVFRLECSLKLQAHTTGRKNHTLNFYTHALIPTHTTQKWYIDKNNFIHGCNELVMQFYLTLTQCTRSKDINTNTHTN